MQVFGATDEDVERLRMVSLVDIDLDRLDQMVTAEDNPADGEDGFSATSRST